MTGALSRSQRFRAEREAGWRSLEDMLARLERGSFHRLTDTELIALPALYRATLSAYSVARATSLDRALIEYLEALSTRAYFVVYGTRTGLGSRTLAFFRTDWPAAARALWRETLLAWLIMLGGVALGAALVASDPEWFGVFVPVGLGGGRDPSATTEFLRGTLFQGVRDGTPLGLFSAYLFTHNAQVAIGAFALGFAFCLPTVLLLAYTGTTLGAFFAVFASRGLGIDLGGWLLVHGVTELSAVCLAGAAGLHIGTAIAAPGAQTRTDAAARAGRQAATLMVGVFLMLIAAGLLEGVVRQVVAVTWQRYAIAGLTGVGWFTYLYAPRR